MYLSVCRAKHTCSAPACRCGSLLSVCNVLLQKHADKDKRLQPSFLSLSVSLVWFSPDVSRVSADEDGTAQTQHIHHTLPAVDHCHWTHLPCGEARGTVRHMHISVYVLFIHCMQSSDIHRLFYKQNSVQEPELLYTIYLQRNITADLSEPTIIVIQEEVFFACSLLLLL